MVRVCRFLRKLKIDLPYDPAIPLLDIYPYKAIIQKDTCTPMFIAALFTTAKTWKKPKWWMDKEDVVHEHNGILLSHKKNEIMPFAAIWVDLEIIILSKVRQRKTNTIWYHLYVQPKIWHKWTYLWNKNILRDIENRFVIAKGEWVRDGLGVWDQQM